MSNDAKIRTQVVLDTLTRSGQRNTAYEQKKKHNVREEGGKPNNLKKKKSK